VRKALSLALPPPEPVDDHEVGSLIDRAGDLGAGIQKLADGRPRVSRSITGLDAPHYLAIYLYGYNV
jgi:hypothetical protein